MLIGFCPPIAAIYTVDPAEIVHAVSLVLIVPCDGIVTMVGPDSVTLIVGGDEVGGSERAAMLPELRMKSTGKYNVKTLLEDAPG